MKASNPQAKGSSAVAPAGGGGAATGNRPCKEADTCNWLGKFAPTNQPGAPSDIPMPSPKAQYWLDDAYRNYTDLYRAIRNIERHLKYGMPWTPQDALTSAPGPNPPPDKKGCPPPPGFP